METSSVVVSTKGILHQVPAVSVAGQKIICAGRWLRIATIFDEDWDPAMVQNPEAIITQLKEVCPQADIFTFAQKLPESEPRFAYPFAWDNVAAVSLTTYQDWWDKLPQATRRNVRLAQKKGVAVRVVPFDDDFVRGIKAIYDESPIRQGKRFWHYNKPFEAVKAENATYSERADFLGAFLDGELIGFLKLVYVGNVGSVMQILSMNKYMDRKMMNALIAKAVEVCIERQMSYLVYCQYVYGKDIDSPLTEFKRRNGFNQVLLPRYYVPLSLKGAVALKLNLHLGLRRLLPKRVDDALRALRARIFERQAVKSSEAQSELIGT